jgi:hypothetical protein
VEPAPPLQLIDQKEEDALPFDKGATEEPIDDELVD